MAKHSETEKEYWDAPRVEEIYNIGWNKSMGRSVAERRRVFSKRARPPFQVEFGSSRLLNPLVRLEQGISTKIKGTWKNGILRVDLSASSSYPGPSINSCLRSSRLLEGTSLLASISAPAH